MHERPTGGKDELAGMVHLVAGIDSDERRLIWGRYVAKGDYTAVPRGDRTRIPAHCMCILAQLNPRVLGAPQHMQLQEDLPPDIAGEVLFGGGIKPNGEWGGNSLFNNKPFRKAMNKAYDDGLGQEAKQALRAQLKANYGNVECNDDQMEEVGAAIHISNASQCLNSSKLSPARPLPSPSGPEALPPGQVPDRAAVSGPRPHTRRRHTAKTRRRQRHEPHEAEQHARDAPTSSSIRRGGST
jgi:hypothetical protein